ncbi:MAG: protein kinase [Proteobacteria bacterium]|nr:protein kinase [Pseudomonadota bacterium]
MRRIAVGGMAEVFLAKSEGVAGFEKYCALKVIHPDLASDESFAQMLIEEAKIAVSLSHANIAQVYELGQLEGTYYIAMEYVEGADLYRILQRLDRQHALVPLDVATYIGQQVATGLHYAHSQLDEARRPRNIVHRDISPQNVLLSYAGEVKIVDFGIAKAADSRRQTEVGVLKGKFRYMAPEQARGGRLDHRADIFSAGAILWEILTGRALYAEEGAEALLQLVREADVPPPSRLRSDIPPPLEAIVLRALARHPDDRWPSALEFQARLTSFLSSYAPDFTAERAARFVQATIGSVPDGAPRPPRPPTELTSAGPDDVPTMIGDDPLGLLDERALAAEFAGTSMAGDPTLADATFGLLDALSSGEDEATTPAPQPDEGKRPTPTLHQVLDFPPYAGPTRARAAAHDTGTTPLQQRHRAPSGAAPSSVEGYRPRVSAAGDRAPSPLAGPASTARHRRSAEEREGKGTPPTPLLASRARRSTGLHPLDQALRQHARRPTSARAASAGKTAERALASRSTPSSAAHAPGRRLTGAGIGLPTGLRVRPRRIMRRTLLLLALASAAVVGGWVAIERWDPFPGSAVLEIISVPSGAAVTINGRPLGQPTPVTVGLSPPLQAMRVALTLEGYQRWSTRTSFRPRERRQRLVASLTPATGSLTVDSNPQGAAVYVNQTRRGITPLTLSNLTLTDRLTIELRHRGYQLEAPRAALGERHGAEAEYLAPPLGMSRHSGHPASTAPPRRPRRRAPGGPAPDHRGTAFWRHSGLHGPGTSPCLSWRLTAPSRPC